MQHSTRAPLLATVFAITACLPLTYALAATSPPSPARALATGKEHQLKYVLWDITALGVSESINQILHEVLDTELSQLLGDGYLARPSALDSKARARVEICGRSTECLAQAGGALGADRVLIGVASVLGNTYSLHLKLIDTRVGKEVARAKTTFSGERNEILGTLQVLLYQLIDPTQLTGSAVIAFAADQATIQIDGETRGTTPLPGPITGLRPGEHSIKISSLWTEDYLGFFTIYPGKTTRIEITASQLQNLKADIETARIPLYKKWWFWTLTATTAGAIAGGAALYAKRHDASSPPASSLGTIDLSR